MACTRRVVFVQLLLGLLQLLFLLFQLLLQFIHLFLQIPNSIGIELGGFSECFELVFEQGDFGGELLNPLLSLGKLLILGCDIFFQTHDQFFLLFEIQFVFSKRFKFGFKHFYLL